MSLLHKILTFIKNEPFGCLVSSILSILLIGALAAGFSFVIFSIWAVSLVKNNIESSTGFNVSAQNIYVNLFTGKCEITGLRITNPEIYDAREQKNKNASGSDVDIFLIAEKIAMILSPSDLLKGQFKLSAISADISLLNCVRLNNSASNLPEFIVNILKITSASEDSGKPTLKLLDLKIKNAYYTDYSTSASNDKITWKMNMNYSFRLTDISDFPKALKEIRESFEKANAPFISNSLGILSNDIM